MQKISQREIAELIGITPSALSQFETENGTLSTETLLKIAPLLNINPDFILNNSRNPFKSDKLIKMFIPGLLHLNFSMLYNLVEANAKIDFIAMHPERPLYDKIFSQTVFGTAIYAIAAKDQDGNLFLFRRSEKRVDDAAIVGMLDFQTDVNERIKREPGKVVGFKVIKIQKELESKIREWTVVREDIEPLFDDIKNNLPPQHSQSEENFLKLARERGIKFEELEPHIIEMCLDIMSKYGKGAPKP